MSIEETTGSPRHTAFPVTRAVAEHLEPVQDTVRPALLAAYRDLASLRYDFPLVLLDSSAGGAPVRSLTSVINDLLQEVAPRGIEGERMRRDVLRAERAIRRLVADGARGTLTELWEQAAPDLADIRLGLSVDGELAECDQELPRRLVEHAWRGVQRQKADRFHAEVNRLIEALSEILRAAFVHSEAGRSPESLRAAFGAPHHGQFDFDAMSRLLGKGAPRDELPADRRERIERALSVLRRQRFFEHASGTELADAPEPPFEYCYGSCAEVLDAFQRRLPQLVEYVKAMSIAALEADGRYVASEHDAFFDQFDEESLGREDLAQFPDYLACVTADESAAVAPLLTSGVPVKVLVETEQLLDTGRFSVGMRGAQLAGSVVGLVDVFVLQTTCSNVYRLREQLVAGLEYAGPALVSIFTGVASPAGDLPFYLTSAAALEGRAFPAFTYDPTAGPDFPSRFSVDGNPQPELDWPTAPLEYADASLQRVVEQVAFTLADVAVCDLHHAHHFACIPREDWNDGMIPVAEWLSLDAADADACIPYVLVVDENDSLQRLIVDAKLMHAARRCQDLWSSLRELASSQHQQHQQQQTSGTPVRDVSAEPGDDAPPEAPAPAEPEDQIMEEASSDEPWIETPRCSTCNECTAINDRMFAYNENKQAYVKDPDAGTFRELVEAAESCQVAVIHPGKPRNPNEPGIEELIDRARAFQ
jgi:hypothetical protein